MRSVKKVNIRVPGQETERRGIASSLTFPRLFCERFIQFRMRYSSAESRGVSLGSHFAAGQCGQSQLKEKKHASYRFLGHRLVGGETERKPVPKRAGWTRKGEKRTDWMI